MSEVIRQAVNKSEHSRYAICMATGIEQSSLSRFMDGRTSLRLDRADKLAAYLGLVLVKKDR